MADAVDGGGVYPVHTKFEGAMDGGDGVRIVLMSPREIPAAAANGPGTVANRGNLQIGTSELARFHIYSSRVRAERCFASFMMPLNSTFLEMKVRRNWLEKSSVGRSEDSRSLIGKEGGVPRDGFAIGICDDDALRARYQGGCHDGKRVHILEGDSCKLGADGDSGAALKTAATNCHDRAASCGTVCGSQSSNSQRDAGQRDDGDTCVLRSAVLRCDGEEALAVFVGDKEAAVEAVDVGHELLRQENAEAQ